MATFPAALYTIDGELRFQESGGGTDYTGLKAAAAISTSYTLTLPSSDSSGTQALVSNGSGTLSWASFGTGNGTVTSVGLSLPSIFSVSGSPVTSSGTLAGSLANQSANTVFAGPTTGAATTPAFRALVSDDIPALAGSKITSGTIPSGVTWGGVAIAYSSLSGIPSTFTPASHVHSGADITSGTIPGTVTWGGVVVGALYGGTGFATYDTGELLVGNVSGTLTRLAIGTAGQVLTVSGGDAAWATPSSGTVTSVALSLPSFITVSGSPVTSSGTLTGTLANQTANTIFSGPTTGAAAAPTFRALVSDDIPVLAGSKITSGTIPGGVTWNGAIIGSAYGGTGNGFTKFTGPTTSEKTFTLPNVSTTIWTAQQQQIGWGDPSGCTLARSACCSVSTCDAAAINTVLQRVNAIITDLRSAGIFAS